MKANAEQMIMLFKIGCQIKHPTVPFLPTTLKSIKPFPFSREPNNTPPKIDGERHHHVEARRGVRNKCFALGGKHSAFARVCVLHVNELIC